MRLANEIIGYEEEITKLKKKYEATLPEYRQEISRELNSRRHAKALCINFIGNEVIARVKEGKPLQDIFELEEWEYMNNLPAGYTLGDERVRAEFSAASELADKLGILHEYLIR